MNPLDPQSIVSHGLLPFPQSDFDARGDVDAPGPVRAPRSDRKADEVRHRQALVERLGPQ